MLTRSLEGNHLTVAAANWDPWFKFANGSPEGVMWEILTLMQESFNFTTTIVKPPDDIWGNCDLKSEEFKTI